MSHVDEGALHAYLDGALDEFPAGEAKRVREHLESCAECAVRLEEERRIRQDAEAMLTLATPSVDIPSFEDLRAYVKATRPAPSRATVRMYRMGWAASVVLALGAGWMVRGGQLQPVSAPEAELMAPVLDVAGDQAERASQVLVADADQERLDEVVPVPEAPARQLVAQSEVAEAEGKVSADAELTPIGFTEDRAVAAEEVAENVAVTDFADRDEPVAIPEEQFVMVQAEPLPLGDSLAERLNELQTAGAGAAIGAEVAAADRIIELRRPDGVVVTALTPPAPATSGREQARRGDERGRIQLTSLSEVDALAVSSSPSEVQTVEIDDEAGLIVPGLEVLGWSNIAEGPVSQGEHVTQRLANGEVLDVYHLPPGVHPEILGPLGTGRNEVRAEREGDGGWVVLRAVLSLTELRELLARMDSDG